MLKLARKIVMLDVISHVTLKCKTHYNTRKRGSPYSTQTTFFSSETPNKRNLVSWKYIQ